MTDWNLPWTAHCRCERTELQITQPPMGTMACHCTGCQRMSASAFSLSIAFPPGAVKVTKGETEIGGLHGADVKHFHCTYCKAWMYTQPAAIPLVNVRATMLDDHAWVRPMVETWTSEGFAWAKTGAKHSFPKLPPDEFWPAAMEEFATGDIHP